MRAFWTLHQKPSVSMSDQHWWKWTVFLQYDHMSPRLYFLCPVFGTFFLFFWSLMQILKSLTSPWKLSAEPYAKVPQSPHKEICTHSLRCCPPVHVCACALFVCMYVLMCVCVEEERGEERGAHSNVRINPSAFCSDGASPVLIISVQILVQSFT